MSKLNVRMRGFGAVFGVAVTSAAFSFSGLANAGTAIMLIAAAAINFALAVDEGLNA